MIAAQTKTPEQYLLQVDRDLSRTPARPDLMAIKDALLQINGERPDLAFAVGARLARVNLRLKGDPGADSMAQRFMDSARRLLPSETFEILMRDAIGSAPAPPPIAEVQPVRASFARPVLQPLSARMHEVVAAASSRPMRFDPTSLIREFGREQVLGAWNVLRPEDRPETAAEFRAILRRAEEGQP